MTTASAVDDFLGTRPRAIWRQRTLWLLVGLALVVLVVLVGRFVNGGAPTRYATELVGRDDVQAALTGSGMLQSVGHEQVGASEPGTIGTVLVRQGERVSKGQLLAQLDPAPFQEEIDRAVTLSITRQTAMTAAQAKTEEQRSRLAGYERVRTESNGLAPSDREMALARQDLRQAQAELHGAQIEFDAARDVIAARQARLALTDIRSPIDGVVTRLAEQGQETGPDRKQALFEIAAPYSRLRLEIMLERAAAGALHVGATAQVSAADTPSRSFPAAVAVMRPARSADASRFILALDVSNPELRLRPGMTATARIGLGLRQNSLVVPDAALRFARASDAEQGVDRAKGDAVYVLGEGNTPRRVPVTVQGGDGARRAVTSDALEPGMPVITGLR